MNIKIIKMDYGFILRLSEQDTIGSVELIKNGDIIYIENIYLNTNYRCKGYLRKIINFLRPLGKLTCLPLPEHIEKFKHLGFKEYKKEGEDIYYSLED